MKFVWLGNDGAKHAAEGDSILHVAVTGLGQYYSATCWLNPGADTVSGILLAGPFPTADEALKYHLKRTKKLGRKLDDWSAVTETLREQVDDIIDYGMHQFAAV
jgi:hypothetical protein